MNKWHPPSARSGILNLLVVLSLLAGLFGFGLDGVSVAQAAGAGSAAQQEATETPSATTQPSDTPDATTTDTTEPAPTETLAEATAEPSGTPSATAQASGTPTPSALPTQQPPAPQAQGKKLAALIVPAGLEPVEDAYIVVYKPGINVALSVMSDRARIEAFGGKVNFVYTAALQGYAAFLPGQALEEARANPLVDYVIADGVVSLDVEDFALNTQSNAVWGLDRIDQGSLPLSNTYSYTTKAGKVHVYVIDTGIYTQHNQFGGRANKVFDGVNDGKNGKDCHGHGTHVAGTIGGSKYGVAKKVKLHGVRVLNCKGSGNYSWVIAGVEWVTLHHIKPAVANMSLGGSPFAPLDTAIENSIAAGVVYVLAAGNSNDDACNYSPARTGPAITVGATRDTDARASFSNYGSCLDLFAPGQYITSAWIGNKSAVRVLNGTSMAAPHVAGVAALYLAKNPSATPAQVRNALVNGATTGSLSSIGSGSPNRLVFSRFWSLAFGAPAGLLVADLPASTRDKANAL